MADTINIKFKVMEDGSLKAIGTQAEKTADSVDKVGRSARSTDRNLKGTAQMTSNATKSFSKMSQGITGGLVPAYATLAANVFALSAAFNFFKRAADVKILEEGQISYGKNTGLALQTVTRGLREASGGMLGFREAAEAAAIGVAKGFSPKQLNDLAEGARKASAALGRNFEDSFDRLIRGASKAEPELLDELGITLRLETATKKYGEAIGKNAKDLTAFERSQAVLIETQRQLNDMYGDMEGQVNPFVKLGKTFDDLVKAGTNFIMPLFEGIANIINRSAIAAVAVFGALGVSILKAMIPMDGIKESFEEFEASSAESMQKAIDDQIAYQTELEKTKQAIKASKVQTVQSAARGMGQTDSKLVQKAQKGELTDPKQIGQLKATLKRAEAEYKKHGEIRSGIFKGKDIEQVRSLKMSLMKMDKDHMGFVKRQKMRFKGLTLAAKKHYMSVKAAGTRAFMAIGKAAAFAGKAINKAMKLAGVIGMVMMVMEMIKSLATNIGTVMKFLTKGFDLVVNGIVGMMNTVLGGFGSLIDGIKNGLSAFLNLYIKAYNMIPGVDDIEEFKTNSTSAKDAMSNLIGTVNTSADDSWLNRSAMRLQNFTLNSIESKEAMNELKDAIKETGSELDSLLEGMAKKTGAGKETAQATALSSLNVSGLMSKAMGVEDEGKRNQAIADLKTQLQEMGKLSPAALEALNNMDVAKMEQLETTAQAAVGGLGALKDGIQNINQALASGDLLTAEFALKALKTTAESTGTAFETLFGADSEAAKKALADFDAAFSGANMTSEEFLQNLIDLRAAQEALSISQAKASLVGGTFAETFKLQNDVTAANLAVKAKELEIEKETDEVKKARLQTELQLLQIEQQKAGIALAGDQMGSQMGAAKASAALKDQGAQAQLSPMLGELAKLGPEGELIQSVVNGAFAIQNAFSNAFEVMGTEGATVGEKVQAGLEVAATAMNVIGGIMKQASQAQIAEIDQQIEAEKKRDGKSKESVAKIAALEKKKEQAKRKAFERDKKVQMAQVVMATASAVMQSFKNGGGYPTGIPMAAAMGAIGAAQLAMISGMTYQGGGSGGGSAIPTKITAGEGRSNTIDLAKSNNASGEQAYMRGAQGTGQAHNFKPAFAGYKHRQAGGYVVGEQGPELFMPETPGQIIPAGKGGGGVTNVNFSISAVDATGVEELLTAQKGNIIGMIREAAHEHGEPFLETVKENTY